MQHESPDHAFNPCAGCRSLSRDSFGLLYAQIVTSIPLPRGDNFLHIGGGRVDPLLSWSTGSRPNAANRKERSVSTNAGPCQDPHYTIVMSIMTPVAHLRENASPVANYQNTRLYFRFLFGEAIRFFR